jgi:hypothetical protein
METLFEREISQGIGVFSTNKINLIMVASYRVPDTGFTGPVNGVGQRRQNVNLQFSDEHMKIVMCVLVDQEKTLT